MVIDVGYILDGSDAPMNNPYMLEVQTPQDVPTEQLEDILSDASIIRWGFYKSLTHTQRMISDPVYRMEHNAKIEQMKPTFPKSSVEDLSSAVKDLHTLDS